jgi:proteasome lid subunit RPN8/RPN11
MKLTPVSKPAPIRVDGQRSQVVGRLHRKGYPIFCDAKVLDDIIEYSEEDLHTERGGFLLGGLYRDQRNYIEIQHFVPAQLTIGKAASMTFTHDTWAALSREVITRFPEALLLGWHHTHPGFGIFLSSYDRFIHDNFFSQPWHVALVVDPQQQELGFFQWSGGLLVDCGFVVVPPRVSRSD